MICHNVKNGFQSIILSEVYNPDIVRIYAPLDGKTMVESVIHDVVVSHDMFGSTLTLHLEDETYIIYLDKIISDILEVEHENETLYADR